MRDFIFEAEALQSAIRGGASTGACSPELAADLLEQLDRLLVAFTETLGRSLASTNRGLAAAERATRCAEKTQADLEFKTLAVEVLKVIHEGIVSPSAAAAAMAAPN